MRTAQRDVETGVVVPQQFIVHIEKGHAAACRLREGDVCQHAAYLYGERCGLRQCRTVRIGPVREREFDFGGVVSYQSEAEVACPAGTFSPGTFPDDLLQLFDDGLAVADTRTDQSEYTAVPVEFDPVGVITQGRRRIDIVGFDRDVSVHLRTRRGVDRVGSRYGIGGKSYSRVPGEDGSVYRKPHAVPVKIIGRPGSVSVKRDCQCFARQHLVCAGFVDRVHDFTGRLNYGRRIARCRVEDQFPGRSRCICLECEVRHELVLTRIDSG